MHQLFELTFKVLTSSSSYNQDNASGFCIYKKDSHLLIEKAWHMLRLCRCGYGWLLLAKNYNPHGTQHTTRINSMLWEIKEIWEHLMSYLRDGLAPPFSFFSLFCFIFFLLICYLITIRLPAIQTIASIWISSRTLWCEIRSLGHKWWT